MKINEFNKTLEAVSCCYAESIVKFLPKLEDFPKEFLGEEIDLQWLQGVIDSAPNCYYKSVTMRIMAISELRIARDSNTEFNLQRVWKLISDSISILPTNATISSIGSQGFLSIPLFKYDREMEKFDFIRLHIWDDSLSKYIDERKCQDFSIHTHSFYAKSWILCGKIINDRYKIVEVDTPTNLSLFTVGYNQTLNKVNQHFSVAENKNNYVLTKQISHEEYMSGSAYSINAGEFHRSISHGQNGFSATLFSFTANDGRVDQSFVVGPAKSTSSEINRKMLIDPTNLIVKINNELK